MHTLATAFWRRLDVPGHDAASLRQTEHGYALLGQSVFRDSDGPVALRYALELKADWSTVEGRITGFIGERQIDDHIVRTPKGWTFNDRDRGMADVLDLDLGFTPATNMIQLKRVALAVGESTTFDVAWLDAGAKDLERLAQTYRRADEVRYPYKSPQNGYRETIVLDRTGFAASYPDLWRMEP